MVRVRVSSASLFFFAADEDVPEAAEDEEATEEAKEETGADETADDSLAAEEVAAYCFMVETYRFESDFSTA